MGSRGARGVTLVWCALTTAAVVVGTSHASADTVDAAVWSMNETSGNVMADTSGNSNDGTTFNIVMTGGTGYQFTPASHSKVIVPDSTTLSPGAVDFSYSVEVSSAEMPPSGTDYDLLRKGIGSTAGGSFKLEIVAAQGQGRAFCWIKDAAGVVASIKGNTDITDGQWHTLTCTKTATGVTLVVDSLTPRTKTVAAGLGSISNIRPLTIGVKSPTVKSAAGDWYNGLMRNSRVTVG
jgi:hypothetical protein